MKIFNAKMRYLWILLALLAQQAMGHAIWIETNTEAKIGDWHEVRIFFGEPNETNKPTPTAKWYSDLNMLSLSLISPSGKETVLEKKQAEWCYYAHFKVEEEGVYKLNINHLVAKVYKRMRLRYQSVAFVSTKPLTETVVLGDKSFFRLGVAPAKGDAQEYRAFYKKRGLKKEKVIFDFSVDKSITGITNKEGVLTFQPEMPNKYIVNLAKQKKNRGKHNGKKHLFDYIWLTYLCANKEIIEQNKF